MARNYTYDDTPWYTYALAWATVSLWSLLHYLVILMPLGGLAWFIWSGSYFGLFLLAISVASSLWPSKPWPGFHRVFNHWRCIFDFDAIIDDDSAYDKKQHYIVTLSPHGVVPLCNLMMLGVAEEMLPWLKVAPGVASVVLRLPFFRQFFTWCGTISVSQANLTKALKKGSVSCVPGGIAELFLSHPEREEIFLRRRRGVCKLALDNKAPLVPLYLFGQTQFHRQLGYGDTWAARISRQLRGSLTLFWGQFGTPIPRRTKVLAVIGKPVPMQDLLANGKLSDQDRINTYHTRWLESFEDIFERYKKQAGPAYAKQTLKIS